MCKTCISQRHSNHISFSHVSGMKFRILAPSEKADIDGKELCPLLTYPRDEKYIDNMLWLLGASVVILFGVGDGMIAYVCMKKRIVCVCIYENQDHQKCITDFLSTFVEKKILAATPGERFYMTDQQLGCVPRGHAPAPKAGQAAGKESLKTKKLGEGNAGESLLKKPKTASAEKKKKKKKAASSSSAAAQT